MSVLSRSGLPCLSITFPYTSPLFISLFPSRCPSFYLTLAVPLSHSLSLSFSLFLCLSLSLSRTGVSLSFCHSLCNSNSRNLLHCFLHLSYININSYFFLFEKFYLYVFGYATLEVLSNRIQFLSYFRLTTFLPVDYILFLN